MNQKNVDFLKESLKYLGFGEKMNAELEGKVKAQPAEFQLAMSGEFGKGVKDRVDYVLDFRKSDQTDMYFFNRYQATLKKDDPGQEMAQTFYINKSSGITAKEAYNLLSGRAVNKDLTTKEGAPFNAWVQLDFAERDQHNNFKVKQYHEGYGYDLDAVLKRYPIKELGSEEDKAKLVKSLEKGNAQQVTFVKDGREEKMFVAANPQFKTLDLYDGKMQKQFQGMEKKVGQEGDKSRGQKEVKGELDEEGEARKTRKRGVGV